MSEYSIVEIDVANRCPFMRLIYDPSVNPWSYQIQIQNRCNDEWKPLYYFKHSKVAINAMNEFYKAYIRMYRYQNSGQRKLLEFIKKLLCGKIRVCFKEVE